MKFDGKNVQLMIKYGTRKSPLIHTAFSNLNLQKNILEEDLL